MNNNIKFILRLFLAVLTGFICGSSIFYCSNKNKPSETIYMRDTILVTKTDTLKFFEKKIIDRHHYDTVIINDTVYLKDEPKFYSDSCENYKIGINAVKLYDYSLDIYKTDTLYQIKETMSQIEKKGHFRQFIGVGVGVGYGGCVGMDKSIKLEPYIGIHFTYGWGYTW